MRYRVGDRRRPGSATRATEASGDPTRSPPTLVKPLRPAEFSDGSRWLSRCSAAQTTCRVQGGRSVAIAAASPIPSIVGWAVGPCAGRQKREDDGAEPLRAEAVYPVSERDGDQPTVPDSLGRLGQPLWRHVATRAAGDQQGRCADSLQPIPPRRVGCPQLLDSRGDRPVVKAPPEGEHAQRGQQEPGRG